MNDSFLSSDIEVILEEAHKAETSFDLDALRLILEPIWTKIDKIDLSSLTTLQQAEIYRLIGYLFILQRRSTSPSEIKIQGKFYLDKALKIFTSLQDNDKVYLIQNLIAYYYSRIGKFVCAERLLKKCENYYSNDKSNFNYVQSRVIYIIVLHQSRRLDLAQEAVTANRYLIENFAPLKVKIFYYNQAGTVCYEHELFDEAIYWYQQAINHAKILRNRRLTVTSKYHLSKVYRKQKKYSEALSTIDKALTIARSLNDYGLLANLFTSKAETHNDMGQADKAISTINKAIFYHRAGPDYVDYASAMWVRIEILLGLNRYDDAKIQFEELIEIVSQKCDPTVKLFYKKAYKKIDNSRGKSTQLDKTIFRINTDADNSSSILFSIPAILAKLMFDTNERTVVETEKAPVKNGEFVIFLINSEYLCGQLIKREDWYLRDLLTFKEIPIDYAKRIRAVKCQYKYSNDKR